MKYDEKQARDYLVPRCPKAAIDRNGHLALQSPAKTETALSALNYFE